MKIHIIGKSHLSGTSKKTGNPYDFIQIHYIGKARNVEGLAGQTFNLDPLMYPYNSIKIEEDYVVEFDNGGYPVEFYPDK